MTPIHSCFPDDQVKHLIHSYEEGQMHRAQIEGTLQVSKTSFFALFGHHRKDPCSFSVAYHRRSPRRLPDRAERPILESLLEERSKIVDPSLPISSYNYSAARERIRGSGVKISLSTIVERAKAMGCHRPRPKTKAHSRKVITTTIGALIQHDASLTAGRLMPKPSGP